MNEVYVYLIDMKTTKVTEAVTENADGSYSIFLNSRFTRSRLIEAYRHAMSHISNCDFEKSDANLIELMRHSA